MCHQKADFGGSEKFAGTLTGAFCELAKQELVGAAQEIGLHVGEAEPISGIGEGFHNREEGSRIDVALAINLGGEVHKIDYA